TAAPPAAGYVISGHLNADERQRTLKKINELEAQMVSPSWSRKRPPKAAAQSPAGGSGFVATQQLREQAAAEAGNAPMPKPAKAKPAPNFAPTEPVQRAPAPQPAPQPAPKPAPAPKPVPQPAPTPAPVMPSKEAALQATSPIAVFEGTDDFQVEVLAEARQNPEVEEAAIRFANGDVDGAEQGLLALIGDGGEHQDVVDTWLTLFDLYRASGEQLKFDELSIQFAGRFGRSAPQWMRGVEGGAAAAIPKKITAAAPTPSGHVHWTCPSALGAQSLATLNASISRAASPWRIDWRYLKSIDPLTLPALTEIFNRWADTDGRFKFLGTDVLLQLLEENAPTENRDVDPQWWKVHLALLRVLDEMDEFDMVALNYCITYEVSPPPWMPPKCRYSPMDEEGQTLLPNDFGDEALSSALSGSRMSFQDTRPTAAPTRMPDEDGVVRAELEGELLISAADVLAPLVAQTTAQAFAIDCRHLQRVDFGAAGDLLNWAMTLHSGGHSVTFQSVNRIVAAFFGVVGLNQAARITLRRD
ncbi:MAG: STAS domain-containing protein, partial [Rhodocyclaceae bacterium]|nr:STAS domain-containing protein [Rhodocyclaceae bacterium]